MQRLKKGIWTKEEDRKLLSYIQKHGEGGWRLLPQKAGLMRCGKSCRLRWANYLRPGIRRGEFTPEEDQTIIRLHAVLGNRWATISRHLYRRTDNEIKNHWNTHLKNRVADHTNVTEEHPLAAEWDSTEDSGENNSPIGIEEVISGPTTSVPSTYHNANTVDTDLTQNLHCSDDNDTINVDLIFPSSSEGNCRNSGSTTTSSATTIRTNIFDFEQAHSRSSTPSSSAWVLNKIASKMGRLNIRHASLDCSVGCPADGMLSSSTVGFNLRSPVTDSSAASKNVEGMFEDATMFQQTGVSEVCEGQLMCLQSMEFQCPIEELYTQSTYSYNDIGFDDIMYDDLQQSLFTSVLKQ